MTPERRQSKKRRHSPEKPPRPSKQSVKLQRRRQPLGRRGWLLRIALAVVAPLVFILCTEVLLWGLGVGVPASFFVEASQPNTLTPNQMFIWFYRPERSTGPHPSLITVPKPANTLRAFVLGGSAAMGTPKPSYGFTRILELMLQDQFPDHEVEVINAAMRGINSHILVPIARQCAQLQPDLMIVYSGNNEHTGRYGADTLWGKHPGLIPLLHAAKRPRVSQLIRRTLEGVVGRRTEQEPQSMASFRANRKRFDDPERSRVYRNFRENLTEICKMGLEGEAHMLLLTLPVNLRDCPPLGSLHRVGLQGDERKEWETLYAAGIAEEQQQDSAEALPLYEQAAFIDDHFAELQFRLARTYLAQGRTEQARDHFSLARDWDALQFRTDSPLNDSVKAVVAQMDNTKVHYIDVAHQWAQSEMCVEGIPGYEVFNDHVHFNFRGDYEMAKAILPTAVAALEQRRGVSSSKPAVIPAMAECARRLAYTDWDHIELLKGIARMNGSPPFTDQLNHGPRQKQAEQTISQLIRSLDRETLEN
ncbi:MAG: tetratricopeptide repeat protein, partial [Planctomycetes bacterium]|nr:tetratricopeptide repeat protein [Planctomycetota bacterium]